MPRIVLIAIFSATMVASAAGGPEPGSSGLQIINAQYGAQSKWIDVTAHLKDRVKDNYLFVHASNELAGDPIFGVAKTLKVKYRLDGVEREVQRREGLALRIGNWGGKNALNIAKSEGELLELAKRCPGELGFYAKNLRTGKTVAYREDEPACMASMVKIYVLLQIMQEAEQGSVDFKETVKITKQGEPEKNWTIEKSIHKMIGVSDNEATNALAARFGYDKINSLPKQLGIDGVSHKILPEPGVLAKVLDERVTAKSRAANKLLEQHATARAMAKYYEMLHRGQLISPAVSKRVVEVFEKSEPGFAPESKELGFKCIGKGGSLLWSRPPRQHYNMVGWAGLAKKGDTAIAFCIWSEFFPIDDDEPRLDWLYTLTDSMIAVTSP